MRTTPTAGRLAVCGLAALAGLLMAASIRPALAAEGVVRISDKANGIVQTGHAEACATSCSTDGSCSPCGTGCRCADGCVCGSGRHGLLGKLFGKGGKCRCGSGCKCGNGGCRLCDLNGDGNPDPCGYGICKKCGKHGSLYGNGYCGSCCGCGCCLPGIPIPCCLGFPCLCCCGCFGANGGALGGTYGRVYALNPYYHDFRDGAVYAAQGYNAPIAVPLAPNVDYQWNYGWGIPSSRLTPVSRVVPSPYGPQPQFAVPPGYVPAAGIPPLPADPEKNGNGNGNGN